MGGGGHVEFYPYKKGWAEKAVAMRKGGTQQVWGSFYMVA